VSTFVVGVDGGGTRTQAVALGLHGQLLGRAVGGAALLDVTNASDVALSVHQVAEAAAAEAGLTLPAAALFAGVAGGGRPEVRAELGAALAQAGVAEVVDVGTDVTAAARDALGTGPGIVLLAGTGSIAWGRGESGAVARVGGWGILLGDEGSGYDLGLEGLRAVARARDGRGPATELTRLLLAATGVEDPEALIPWASRASKGDIAALASVVAEAASGDDVAGRLLVAAAVALAVQATTLADRLGPWKAESPPVALAGGLLSPGGPLRDRVESLLSDAGLSVVDRGVDGARGAGLLALDLVGGRPSTGEDPS
jgi:glucosamine kinase